MCNFSSAHSLNVESTSHPQLLRPWDCKYRELIFKTDITDFFMFCQEKPLGELFLKISLRLAQEFLILRNPTKSRISVFGLWPP